MNLPKHIFRAYDIRGIYPEDLNEKSAYLIGRGLATYMAAKGYKTCVIGKDNRKSSDPLEDALVSGLLDSGTNVVNTGFCNFPLIHLLTYQKEFDFGVYVSASHLPKKYNGIKIDYKNSLPFCEGDLKALYALINKEDFLNETGTYKVEDLSQAYVMYFGEKFKFKKKHRILIDCGNGASSFVLPKIMELLDVDCVSLSCNPDSEFPREVPDPTNVEYIKTTISSIKYHKVDFGVAFDGDGDRIGVFDEQGIYYDAGKMFLLISKYLSKTYKGKKVIYDVKNSFLVPDYLDSYDYDSEISPTGRTHFLKSLHEDASLGIEYSGHMYFGGERFLGYDDPLTALCLILELLEKEDKPLSVLLNEYPKTYNTSELKIEVHESEKFELLKKIVLRIKERVKAEELIEIDGIRVNMSATEWFLIRASNTSPYLTLRFESETYKDTRKLINLVGDILSEFSGISKNELKKFTNSLVVYS